MKKKILKTVAVIVSISLVAVIAFFANAFLGNPISKKLASDTAEKHLAEKYADTDFEIERVFYDFKDSCYHVFIRSPSSIDSHFSLSIDMLGRLGTDYYENDVLSKWNTSSRINNEYSEKVDAVLNSPAFPYNENIGFGDIEFVPPEFVGDPNVPYYAINMNELTVDAVYDINEFGASAGKLTIYIDNETVSYERLAEIALDIKRIFDEADIKFYALDLVLEYPKNEDGTASKEGVRIMDFLYTDIYEDGLLERIKANSNY